MDVTIKYRIKGIASSLIFSVPLSYAIYFILGQVVELQDSLFPKYAALLVFAAIGIYSLARPNGFIFALKSIWKLWNVLNLWPF
ncbi:hypothetical protein KQ940_22250 [Marinobacterium sp. D7]|uniref:hypothetical protein n=1 Tax=Marinobacterium ramblicola TaxID=2849041 RepID=UPI001C2D63C7|nr:hypothetical protein [Marinobacterium ramblicola]MBV1790793.1 hypothetical protein [Marinobacterium ramblicola]